ncbi:hypothetical protein [Streptomyces sp. NEAU-174]|uniref:hypothetical protein n=1 Tax=Streptomyces sp. NEAU-174 TaxID=3458254 RepID=UPI004044FF14
MTSPRIVHTTIALDGNPDSIQLEDIGGGTLVLRLGESVTVLLGAASPTLLYRLAAVAGNAAVTKVRAQTTEAVKAA